MLATGRQRFLFVRKAVHPTVLGMDEAGDLWIERGVSWWQGHLSSFKNGRSTACCVSLLQGQSEEVGQLAVHVAILL